MFIKRYYLLAFSAFFLASMNTHAHTNAVVVKKKLPIECTDRENYDSVDCEKAQQLKQWTKDQEKVPDKKRLLVAGFGEDVLIEKATGFRIGPHKIETAASKQALIGIKIGMPNAKKMYVIGGVGGCDLGAFIEVLNNAPQFVFFVWQCDYRDRDGKRNSRFNYYNFDKRYSRLDNVFSTHGYNNKSNPTLTFTNGSYNFRWKKHVAEKGFKPDFIFNDFKITGNRPDDLTCSRSWNDECDIAQQDGPIPTSQYKTVDE